MRSSRLSRLSTAYLCQHRIPSRPSVVQSIKVRRAHTPQLHRSMSSAGFPPPQLKAAAEEVAALLKSRGETICCAETAAGGLISAALLSTPGASKIYRGGLMLYTLESRIAFAGWTQQHIDDYDGPTPDLVAGLAKSVREQLKATYAVGESGTAGPTASGKTPNRQPGYVALAVCNATSSSSKDVDTGKGIDREANMVAFAIEALHLVKAFIEANSAGGKL